MDKNDKNDKNIDIMAELQKDIGRNIDKIAKNVKKRESFNADEVLQIVETFRNLIIALFKV